MNEEETIARYAEIWQLATTPELRRQLVAIATRNGEAHLCDAGLIRSTYIEGIVASAPETVSDIHRTIVLTDEEMADLQCEADEIKDVEDKQGKVIRDWNEHRILLGVLGEEIYSRVTGIARTTGKFYDGGEDFPGVDAKAVPFFETPLLHRLVTDPLAASYYVLVAADLQSRKARYVGYATRDELRAAPVRDYRFGPTLRLTPGDLRPELPPT